MDGFIIKSISLSQKKVQNIEIKEIPLWQASTSNSHYAIKFEYADTLLYLTYTHRQWKGKLVEQVVKEIDNKIKEYDEEKEEKALSKQTTRIMFALDTKIKMQLNQGGYNIIMSGKNMEEKINYITQGVKRYRKSLGYEPTMQEVYPYCINKIYEDLAKKK